MEHPFTFRQHPLAGIVSMLALTLVLIAVFFPNVVLRGGNIIPGDVLEQFIEPFRTEHNGDGNLHNYLWGDGALQNLPWLVFISRSYRTGVIPLWNPHNHLGQSLPGSGFPAPFYPLNMIAATLVRPERASTIIALTAIIFISLFTYLLLRQLAAGWTAAAAGATVAAFSSYSIAWLPMFHFNNTACWLPAALAAAERGRSRRGYRWPVLQGAALALALLGGQLQLAAYILLAVMLHAGLASLSAARSISERLRPVRNLVIALLLAGALAAPQVLPSLEQVSASYRPPLGRTSEFQMTAMFAHSLRPPHLLLLLQPYVYGSPLIGWSITPLNNNERALYVGVLPLLALPLAPFLLRRRRGALFYPLLWALSFLWGLGTPFYWLLFRFAPGFSMMKPCRMAFLQTFALAITAGLVLDQLSRRDRQSERCRWPLRGIVFSAWALYVSIAILGAHITHGDPAVRQRVARWLYGPRWNPADFPDAFWQLQDRGFALLAITATVSCAVLLWGISKRRRWLPFAALLVIYTDLWAALQDYPTVMPRRWQLPESAFLRQTQQAAAGSRITGAGPEIIAPNVATLCGVYDAAGYDSLAMKRYHTFLREFTPRGVVTNQASLIQNLNSPLLRRLAVQHIIGRVLPVPANPLQKDDELWFCPEEDTPAKPTLRLIVEVILDSDSQLQPGIVAAEVTAYEDPVNNERVALHLPEQDGADDADLFTDQEQPLAAADAGPVRMTAQLSQPMVIHDVRLQCKLTQGQLQSVRVGYSSGSEPVRWFRQRQPAFAPVPQAGQLQSLRVFRRLDSDPYLVLSRGYRPAGDDAALLRALACPRYDPRDYVFLQSEPERGLELTIYADEVLPEPQILSRGSSRQMVQVDAETDCVLYQAESYAPGWRAWADGREVPVYRANYLFRAVLLSAGTEVVDWRYEPPTFRLGAFVSFVGLLVITAGAVSAVRIRAT